MITRKEAEAISKELGIGVVPKDDPIYNELPSVRFINKSTRTKRMKKIEIEETNDTEVFSPYTGNCVTGEDGEIVEDDNSLLFVFSGMANDYAYISDQLRELVDVEVESIEMGELVGKINHIEGTLMEVDNGWNGVNYYCFIDPNK